MPQKVASHSDFTVLYHYKYLWNTFCVDDFYRNERTSRSSRLDSGNVAVDESLNVAVSEQVSCACLGRETNLQLPGVGADEFADLRTVLEGDESGHLVQVLEPRPRIW